MPAFSRFSFFRLMILIGLSLLLSTSSDTVQADEISFNRQIRGILSNNCFSCHGPDAEQRQGGLRLDEQQTATSAADSGARAIVPGDSAASELIARIMSRDPDVQMPPPDSEHTLTTRQKQLLRDWIQQGAQYEGHWAFIPPQRPKIPREETTSANPVDHFLQRQIRLAGLKANPAADRETLIRRASLDLTGLPPRPDDVAEFLADTSPNAYEKVVDRLLMSPHFGERMAVPWLDMARFADSNGFQSDGSRSMWAWRDWVIHAFNRNQPFDEFTIDQLAGDMRPNATPEQIVATGFNRNHRLNGEGGRIVDEWFVETVIDRVETTGLTWLGLTFNCCRCHDHKFDPISQREFYQLFAIFNSVEESGVLAPGGKRGENTPPLYSVVSSEQKQEEQKLLAAVKSAKRDAANYEKQLPDKLKAWIAKTSASLRDAVPVWTSVADTKAASKKGATLKPLPDGSFLATGTNPPSDVYEITLPLRQNFSGALLEFLPDRKLAAQSLGRGSNGNFVITRIEAEIVRPNEKQTAIPFATATADFAQDKWPAASVIGGGPGWAIAGFDAKNKVPRKLMLVAKETVSGGKNAVLRLRIRHDSPFPDHNSGRFRILISDQPRARLSLLGDAIPQEVRDALLANSRSKKQQAALETYFRNVVANPAAAVKAAENRLKEFKDNLPTTMVMKEGKRRDAFILNRGEYDKRGDKVTRAIPAALVGDFEQGRPDRMKFAQWVVSDSNPLTARVWVNRMWAELFGTGIVKTTENFGSQAEYPSHPELLDFLASEFMQPQHLPPVNGTPAQRWDMKALIKLLVTSDAYRRSTTVSPEAREGDPDNRLLARGPRFRLTGEFVRDQALAASGLLVPKVGGRSVRPYMPPKVWDETSVYGNLRNYRRDKGDGLYRRTMYTIWKRTAAPPTMLLFDAPNREVCTVNRSRTNTPLQALSLLNEVTFVEASRALAERMLNFRGETDAERLAFGFRCAFARTPSDEEVSVLLNGLQRDRERFAKEPAAAEKLVGFGDHASSTADAPELAAWTLTANVLLNLDEFITRE